MNYVESLTTLKDFFLIPHEWQICEHMGFPEMIKKKSLSRSV